MAMITSGNLKNVLLVNTGAEREIQAYQAGTCGIRSR